MNTVIPKLSARRWKRRLLIGIGVFAAIVVVAIGALFAFMKYAVLPLTDGEKLGDGTVTTVITDYFGPVAIGAYLFDLKDGAVGLVDAGSDPDAKAILAALARTGKSAADVRAVFITHQHADHAGGARAFPRAQIYVLESDRTAMEQRGIKITRGLRDAERLDISGTAVEAFGLPSHTPGSAAFLINGVLFLGDSAAAAFDSSFQPNTMMGNDPDQTVRSLRALADRLRSRRGEIRHLAFGHQGTLAGLDPMLKWASASPSN
jgi:glyoxylase-like metal-dependent hydrolase (beta-lactamase superfamily II)